MVSIAIRTAQREREAVLAWSYVNKLSLTALAYNLDNAGPPFRIDIVPLKLCYNCVELLPECFQFLHYNTTFQKRAGPCQGTSL